MSKLTTDSCRLPIGIFDSGVGGLTVAREIIEQMPQESILYFGDTLRCPYGSRSLSEIRQFALQISRWLIQRGIKILVVACNSATAAALEQISAISPVPTIGVVAPGARAACEATASARVGIIGTEATINSGVYSRAIAKLDPACQCFCVATPQFANMVEQGLHMHPAIFGGDSDKQGQPQTPSTADCEHYLNVAQGYLGELVAQNIDTLVLGCTHYPLLKPLIAKIMGHDVRIISSAAATAHEVMSTLVASKLLAPPCNTVTHSFAGTATDDAEFVRIGSAILGRNIYDFEQVDVSELEALEKDDL